MGRLFRAGSFLYRLVDALANAEWVFGSPLRQVLISIMIAIFLSASAWLRHQPIEVVIVVAIGGLGVSLFAANQIAAFRVRRAHEKAATKTVIIQRLSEFHVQGEHLIAQVLDDEDPSNEERWFEKASTWLRQLLSYVSANLSQGKADYIRYLPILPDVNILHKEKAISERRKQTIRGVEYRLKRLRDVMKDI